MQYINNNNAFLMAAGDGSRIEIHAADAVKDSWTQINKTANAGDATLTLDAATGWEIGDKIAIAATSFDTDEAEERTIVAISSDGQTITLDQPLEHEHFGEVETHGNGKSGADFQSWDMDMRAEVALLSRNVTIQGDADSAEDGYGGHTMVMDGASMHIDGAELTQMGQEGEVGRYALHWHMLGDASGQYITNTSIHGTYNKGMTIHGTQNTWVENNAVFDTVGHSYYFEDGSEFGNVLMNNLGMSTRQAGSLDDAAIGSDFTAPSTYWVTNPNNHLIGNTAAGSAGTGFWMLSQEEVEGISAGLAQYNDYEPRLQNPGQWTGNTSHSNEDDGIFIGRQFDESNGEGAGDPSLEMPFALTDFTTYKNGEFGVWMRNGKGDYSDLKIAESNIGIQMWGASNVSDSLILGRTSNFDERPGGEYAGWQLYDRPVHFEDVHFDGFSEGGDAAIANGWGFGRSANYSADGLTFGDDVPATNHYTTMLTIDSDGFSDRGGAIAGALHDIDGAISGVAGAILTPGIVDVNPGKHTEVETYAYDGIIGSGFNATEGAVWLEDSRVWVNPADSVIGKMIIKQQTMNGDDNFNSVSQEDRAEYSIEKSDNGAKLFINQDAIVSYASSVQLNLDARGDIEYTIDYDGDLPEVINIEITDLPKGATAYYRFKDLPSDVVFQQADAVENRSALDAAEGTAWIRESNGDFVVKVVAEQFYTWRVPRSDTEIVQENIYNDGFRIIIEDRDTAEPSGNQSPFFDPDENRWEPAAPDELPEQADSTSQTISVATDDARWSDATTWDGGIPDANDTIIIGEGQRVVLDADVQVTAILVNGGELVVEDTKDIALSADWILIVNGGLFQVGTENSPFQHDFDLTLEGDDQNNDVNVGILIASTGDDVVRVRGDGPVDPQPLATFAINIGSDNSFTSEDGTEFAADTTGVGNKYSNANVAIPNTENDALYQSHAWSTQGLEYGFEVQDGFYKVDLLFAEIYNPTSEVGKRVFDVEIEGTAVQSELDVFREVGEDASFVFSRTVEVSDGILDIALINDVQNAMLSGLKITSVNADALISPDADLGNTTPLPDVSDIFDFV